MRTKTTEVCRKGGAHYNPYTKSQGSQGYSETLFQKNPKTKANKQTNKQLFLSCLPPSILVWSSSSSLTQNREGFIACPHYTLSSGKKPDFTSGPRSHTSKTPICNVEHEALFDIFLLLLITEILGGFSILKHYLLFLFFLFLLFYRIPQRQMSGLQPLCAVSVYLHLHTQVSKTQRKCHQPVL